MAFKEGTITLAAFSRNGDIIVSNWNTTAWSEWQETNVKLKDNKTLGAVVLPPTLSPQEFYKQVGISMAVIKNDNNSLWFLR